MPAPIPLKMLYAGLACALLSGPASAAEPYPDAIASDPARLGWMVGSPPPPERQVRFDDGSYFRFPQLRWSVSNFRQLMPTMNISRGLDAPAPLERALRTDIDALTFLPLGYQGPRSYYEFPQTVRPEGRHGEAFHYRTANADALGWIIARVSGRSVAQLLSERIWSQLGAEQDAYISVDASGTPFAGGGMNAGLRDLARFGELMRNGGRHNGQQVIPQAVVDDIRAGASREDFAKAGYDLLQGWSYRNMWWVTHNPNGAFMARGVYGQALYIDPAAEMVIARFASHPVAANAASDPTSLPAYAALARHLMSR